MDVAQRLQQAEVPVEQLDGRRFASDPANPAVEGGIGGQRRQYLAAAGVFRALRLKGGQAPDIFFGGGFGGAPRVGDGAKARLHPVWYIS